MHRGIIKGEDPFYDEKYFTFEHPKAKLLGDLGSGVGLYQFDQCNTRPENVADKERKLKAKQEAAVKKAEQEKRPGAKPIVGRETRPETKPPTPEEQAEKAKQIAAQTASMAYDKESTLAKGATITTVKNGIASVAKRNSSSSRKVPLWDIQPQNRLRRRSPAWREPAVRLTASATWSSNDKT